MAFTETQKDQVRQILGFAAGYYQYNTRLESMMDKIGGNVVEQTSVEALMASIVVIDTAVNASVATGLTTGGIKQVDKGDVQWFNFQESGGSEVLIPPKARGKMLVARLAKRFGYTIDELLEEGCAPWFFETASGRGEIHLG